MDSAPPSAGTSTFAPPLRIAILFSFTLIAAFLRLEGLNGTGLWHDEIGHFGVASLDTVASILAGVRTHAAAMPLDYIGLHYFLALLGRGDYAARLWPALWGVFSIPIVYAVVQSLWDSRVGIITAFLWTIAPWHIFYSQEVRFYSSFVTLSLISTWVFLEAQKHRDRRYYAVWMIITLISTLTHLYSLFVVFLQLGWAIFTWLEQLLHRKQEPLLQIVVPIIGTAFSIGAALLWIRTSDTFLMEYLFYQPVPFDTLFVRTLEFWSGFDIAYKTYLLLFIVGSMRTVYLREAKRILVIILVVTAPVIVHEIARRRGYFYLDRQILFVMPYYLMVAAYGLNTLLQITLHAVNSILPRNLIVSVGTTITIILIVLGSVAAFDLKTDLSKSLSEGRVDWRGAGNYLTANTIPGEVIVVSPSWQIRSIFYYYKGSASIMKDAAALNDPSALRSHTGAWVILSMYAADQAAQSGLEHLMQGDGFRHVSTFWGLELYHRRW